MDKAKRSKRRERPGRVVATHQTGNEIVRPWRLRLENRDWLWALLLALAVLAAYQPVWRAGFVWDDRLYISDNPSIKGLSGLKEIWTTRAADISPLTLTTFWVEHAWWGAHPLPYHLVNVLLHAACAVTLGWVLRSLRVPGAWFGAALWALHPVQVESAAWITETKNTQSGLFYLLSILFFLRWLKARARGGWTAAGSYGLALIFAALAMASKSSTVILPVVLALCAWWMEKRWSWRNLTWLVPLALLSLAASALSLWTQGLYLASLTGPDAVRPWPQRVASAGDAVRFYLGKLLWPHPLLTIYPHREIEAGQWTAYLPLGAVIVALGLFGWQRGSWGRPWFFAFAYFVVALLPVLGLFDNPIFRLSLVFDHFQYLASMGPLALAGAGMVRWAEGTWPKRLWWHRVLGAGVLLALGGLSWRQARLYENHETLWTHTLAYNPSCPVAHNNLGNALLLEGQVDEAISHFQRFLELSPDDASASNNLGYALLLKGRIDEAMGRFQEALRLSPGYAEAHNNLGKALLQSGRIDEAILECREALAINPNLAEIHTNLGQALLLKGQPDEARAQFHEAERLKPDDSASGEP
jgi:Flp pilus assembly protein TadD